MIGLRSTLMMYEVGDEIVVGVMRDGERLDLPCTLRARE